MSRTTATNVLQTVNASLKGKVSLKQGFVSSRLTLVLLAALLSSCTLNTRTAAPKYEATITRTTFGIPHIKANDFGSLGFGSAYTRAQDNICMMADAYVSSSGERSRFFGANGATVIGLVPAKNIDSDIFYRTVPDLKNLRAAFARRSADYKAMVDGWIAGYNRYLRDHKNSLPAQCANQSWVREITLDDELLSINSFSILSSSSTLATQIVTAAPPTDAAAQVKAAHINSLEISNDGSLGSNGWAFGGDATTNGKGVVVANPHFPWNGPTRFYETHLTIPGKLDVAGAAIINLPYIGIGFNRDVAWAHTLDMAAHMTLYKLKLDPSDATVYLVDGKREAMTRGEVRIEDKDGATITRTVFVTRYGPVVSVPGTEYAWTKQTAYAVADANNGNVRSGDTWLDIARASKVEDIREALAKHLGAPSFNTLAADRAGTALYADITAAPNVQAERFASCGTVNDRIPGQMQNLYVLDGSRSDCSWEISPETVEPGLLPASKMATLYRRDYVQNSNDSYRWSNPNAEMKLGPIMGKDPGLGLLRTRSGIQEISRVLKSGKFDIDLAVQTMLSNKVLAADLTLPSLLKLCARPDAPRDACSALAKWDGMAEINSKGAMLFNLLWAKIGNHAGIWKVGFDPNNPINTPRDFVIEGKTGDDILAALAAAATAMKEQGLSPDATLGETQFVERGNERIPVSGFQHGGVLNYSKTVPTKGGYSVVFGSSYIQSVTFDDKGPVAKAILTYSQSTDPASPHYADQTREFTKKKLHRFPFSESEIAADAIAAPMTIRQ